jgi:divalent metal cation (Fe/Co/Zn/Cd) transporter
MAEEVEDAILRDVPEVRSVQTHLEPLAERAPGREGTEDLVRIERTVAELTGGPPRELRTLETDDGLVVLLTLALDGGTTLSDAHDEATAVSERIRAALPGVADVVVHTEP